MSQTSYLTFNRNLAFPQGHAFTAYRSVTTRSREGLVPPIAIFDDPMYDDSSDEFDSDDERSVFSRHRHRLLVERARAPSPEDLHSKKGRLGLQLFPTPISTKKASKGHHQIDTSMKWDYSYGPLSPLSGISESDDDSENDENEKPLPAPVVTPSPGLISRSINRGVEEDTSVSPSSSPKSLKRKRSSDSIPAPSTPESPSKRQCRASGPRDGFAAAEPGDGTTDRAAGINTRHVRPVRKTSSGSLSGVPDKARKLVNAGDKHQPETVRQLRSVTRKTQTKSERRANFFGKIRRPRF